MPSPQRTTVEVLLTDVDWLRGLARHLVRDAMLAEDAAQEAWLAALESKRSHRLPMRAWLAGAARHAVLKTLRREGRRRTHEERAARVDRAPSTADVVEHLSTQLVVARAVDELDEPYRETILLRYYEDLPLKEIAARMGAPVPTVAARVQRGLGALQRVLEQRFGSDGKKWVQALLPLTEMGGSPTAATASIPLIWAGRMALFALALGVLGVGFRALLRGGVEPSSVPISGDGGQAPPVAALDRSETAPARQDRFGRSRVAVGPPPTANVERPDAAPDPRVAGSLSARVLHADGTPAANLPVEVRHAHAMDRNRPVHRLRTTLDGGVVLAELPPGQWVIAPALGGAITVSISPSSPVETTLRLPEGPALSGVVVDALGEPVANAGVWLSLSPPQQVTVDRLVQSTVTDELVLRADAEGAFHLPTIGSACTIGARAEGYAPSPAHSLPARRKPDIELRLVLPGPGGAVSGVVSDADGAPVANAAVFVDVGSTETTLPDGRRFSRAAPLVQTRCDARGRFRVFGVAPGIRRVLVRAAGCAPWHGELETVAPGEVRCDVRLDRGMVVAGTITDEGGVPLEGVSVWASRRRWTTTPDVRHASGTRTGHDGRYRLQGVEPGHCWLTVDGGPRGRGVDVLVGGDGMQIPHDVTLAPGLELRGTVLDANGEGIAGLSVRARECDDWRAIGAVTDDAGAFTISGLEDEVHVLQVDEGPVALVRGHRARPGGDALVLRVDEQQRSSAVITGVALEADGRPGSLHGVRLERVDGDHLLELGVESGPDGTFRTSAFPPGIWRIAFSSGGHPDHTVDGEHRVAAHGVLDLGRLRLAPVGSLELRTPLALSGQLFDLHVHVLDAQTRPVHDLRLTDPEGHLPLRLPVTPGVHLVHARAAGFVARPQSVLVRAGRVEPIELALEPGIACAFRFRTSEGEREPARLDLLIRPESGDVLVEETLYRMRSALDFSFSTTVDLAPGVYRFEAEAGDLSARGALTVHAGELLPPLDVLLEP